MALSVFTFLGRKKSDNVYVAAGYSTQTPAGLPIITVVLFHIK